MKSFIRWLLFIFIGYPFQLVVFFIYPFLWLYWRIFIYEEVHPQGEPKYEDKPFEIKENRIRNSLLDNTDDHGAMTMYGYIEAGGLANLLDDGNFARHVHSPGDYNLKMVSGDVVVAWCFAATHPKVKPDWIQSFILKSAKNYLKNLGTLSYDTRSNGDVSNRCNNFGINYCPDSDLLRIGQPMAGPQFYTSSCLFALASLYSWKWKVVFALHWIFLGGWYWAFAPIIYTKNKPVHYARDITMKALYVHKFVFGSRWWIEIPMYILTLRLSKNKNPLFYAMYGLSIPFLPKAMNAFFSQKELAESIVTGHENDVNPVLGEAIEDLYAQSKRIEDGT